MLVYYYLPYGYSGVNGRPLYGRALGRPPTRISYDEYLAQKDVYEMAPFTPSYLEMATGKPFPLSIMFTIDTLKYLDYRTLQKLATYFGVSGLLPHTRLIYALRAATRDL